MGCRFPVVSFDKRGMIGDVTDLKVEAFLTAVNFQIPRPYSPF